MRILAKQEVRAHALDEFDNQGLTPGKLYDVIGISCDNYRVIDDLGEPILYPDYLFEVVDSSIPQTWIRNQYEENEVYIDPPELSRPGFYEDYFDNVPEVKNQFWEVVKRELGSDASGSG